MVTAEICRPLALSKYPSVNLAALAIPPPGMGQALEALATPQSLNARRPEAPTLPSFELPPPNFQIAGLTPKFSSSQPNIHPPSSAGVTNLLTPPETSQPGDGTNQLQPVTAATAVTAGSALPSGYTPAYWPGHNPYSGASGPPQHWASGVNAVYPPRAAFSPPLGQYGRDTSTVASPPTTDAMPQQAYDINQLPPLQQPLPIPSSNVPTATQQQQQQQQQQQNQPNHSKESAIDDSASQDGPYENPRKRGPDEAPSVSDDELDFVCTRHNVVIEYDGHTQQALEDIARKIAISRNNLRRGKMASMIRPGLRMALRNNKALDGASDADSPDVLLSSIRSSRNRTSQSTMCFDMAEKQLELLNSHCEAAAHEVLRVGQCATQLEAMKEKFTALRGMARTEVDRLKKQAQLEAENPVKPSSPQPVKPAAEVNKNPMSNTTAIEVDDDTGESEEVIDMSVFRTARRMRM